MRCQSQPRLPFHLPFLPMSEEGGGGRRRRAHGYITNTHTGWLHYILEAVAERRATSRHSCLSPSFARTFLARSPPPPSLPPSHGYLNDFYPCSSAPVRGCTLEHEKRRVVWRLVPSEPLKLSSFFNPSRASVSLALPPSTRSVVVVVIRPLFLVVFLPSQGTPTLLHRSLRGTIFFSLFFLKEQTKQTYKQKHGRTPVFCRPTDLKVIPPPFF